jgi:hypothetical protein
MSLPSARPGSRQLAILAGAAAALGIALLATASCFAPSRLALPSCPWRALTGIPCPGCGGTRALLRLAGGDPLGAAAMNPAVTVATAGAILLAALCLAAPAAGDRLLDRAAAAAHTRRGRLGLAAVILLEMIYQAARGGAEP